DFFDGVGGGADPEARLKIMKDSAIGVFGAVGLILLLLFKIVCLTAILAQLTPMKYLLIAAVPALCRWSMASLAWKATYPRSKGTGHAFVGKVTGSDLILGGIFLLPALVVGVSAYVLFLFSLMPSVWLRRKSKVALGGVTGDVLGASCEMGEAAGWLGALLCLFWIL
ncbi:MAG: adenosylcobinamide-GDP ribazoletransferase, partial [Proteobacteria bacterium]|nr:adenosylcobinamide-GDP ribazoletransferase [Pseudomonadota bacterium]